MRNIDDEGPLSLASIGWLTVVAEVENAPPKPPPASSPVLTPYRVTLVTTGNVVHNEYSQTKEIEDFARKTAELYK